MSDLRCILSWLRAGIGICIPFTLPIADEFRLRSRRFVEHSEDSEKRNKMSPTYTLYYGTFIQLPRYLRQDTKPCLEINTGVLWVSNCDGRIQGFDWAVGLASATEDEKERELAGFVQRKGWTVWRDGADDDDDATEGEETVRIVQGGRKGKNGFFFPGFIGMFSSLSKGEGTPI